MLGLIGFVQCRLHSSDKITATATGCQNIAHMGPTSGPHGQYIDVFYGKIVSKLRNIPVLTWLVTKEKNQCVLHTLELVKNYKKDNLQIAYGTQVGPKMSLLPHKIVISDESKSQMHP